MSKLSGEIKKKDRLSIQDRSLNNLRKLKQAEKELSNQKKINKRLNEILEMQKTILEMSLTGYYIVLNGKFHIMNSIAIAFSGYSPGELIGKRADFFVHPEDRDAVKKKARAMLSGQSASPYEFRILTQKGETHWLLEAVVPISFEGRRAILGTSMDITQQKLFEQKMIASENLYRTIFETTGTMTMIGEGRKVSMLNSGFERVTGFRREEWEGREWTGLVHKDDIKRLKEYNRLRYRNFKKAPETYEYTMIDSQGQHRHILATVHMIPDTKKFVSSSVDITQLKEAEQQMIIKSERLSELNTTLKVLLKQREDDRVELENKLLSNVREFVLPYMENLRKISLDKRSHAYINLLSSNLENILTPFSRTLSAKYMNFTSKEIEVANFIKDGRNSKEISDLLSVTSSCVDIHRYHIRKKLGLNRRINLMAYLKSLS